MSYSDLLSAVARDKGIASAAELVAKHGHKYMHVIKNRDRARELAATFKTLLGSSLKGRKVLDLGSSMGGLAIELTHLGAEVTAVESNVKRLALAEEHARNEAKINFVKSDLQQALEEFGGKTFDVIFAIDTLPRIYDLDTGLSRLHALLKSGGALAFRIPNGTSPATIDDKRGLGLPLVPPDCWSAFVKTPVGQYHRSWNIYHALLKEAGFTAPELAVSMADESLDRARYKLRAQLTLLKRKLKNRETLSDPKAYIYARNALKPYIRNAEADLEMLPWDALNLKYRAPTWIGVAKI